MHRLLYPCCLLAAGCGLIVPGRYSSTNEVAPVPTVGLETTADQPGDALDRAADAIGRGDHSAATFHLASHVKRHPDQVLFRVQLAELLYRQDRLEEASLQYAAVIELAQLGPARARSHLVHAHTRLMEIAQVDGRSFDEKLHRGIGLLLVASQLAERDQDVQDVCFKAIKALGEAQAERPADGRPSWYLYRAWMLLGQSTPAERALRVARSRQLGSTFTEAERRELAIADTR